MTSDATAPERDPFLEAVGRVTVAGAHLDASLHGLLGAIAFEPTLLKLANAEGTARLIDMCEVALTVGTLAPEDVAEVRACLARARELKDKRNQIVHSIFLQAEKGNGFEAMKPRSRKLGSSVVSLTVEEMEATAKQMAELRERMFRAGWNGRCKMTGMTPIPPPAPSAEASANQE
ncbi:hypothetical protein [Streptomyces sp. NPDC005407]|uniref:hypothetical protein n=1 Tax=Streptomyces sp. NPDC005407 TaxID=3155340 RepID=UPI0033A14BEF